MASIEIQGIICHYRDLRPGENILYENLPQEEQYFRRVEHPFTDEDELVEIASVPYEERKSKYNKVQLEWVEREEKRMTYGEGVYAYINGILKYIPASYWGYVNHWTLENGELPEYRESDRIFFLFFEYICFETDVLGITRGKSRRIGATSAGFYFMWWICGRQEEKRGGSISFNDEAANKNFQTMFMRGFKAMLPCFVRDFDSSAEKFVRFVKPVEKAKKGVVRKREGLNSYCDYLSNSLNAYDSGRLSYGLFDETAKYHRININTYWSKVSPTLKTGRNKVGFAYMPTTVNPKNQGGENYQQFWKIANQNAINPSTEKPYGLGTTNKVVRYFVPAWEGYAGCIDIFGNSIIEDPIEPIMGNDGKLIYEGAKTIILRERKNIEDSIKAGVGKPEQLMEHRRDFPTDEADMFAFATGNCEFDEMRLIARIKYLDEFPVYIRQSRLTDTIKEITDPLNPLKKVQDRKINFMDDKNGCLWLYEKPLKENDFKMVSGHYVVGSPHIYTIGADTIRIFDAEHGSLCAVCVFKKSLTINGEETGNYPVAMWIGRPRVPSHLYDEIIRLCLWYGCKCNIERSAGDYFSEYFYKKNCSDLLLWTPARNPNLPHQRIYVGTESASPFQLQAQLECAKLYFDGNDPIEYNGNIERVVFKDLLQQALEYNHSERTPYDLVVSLQMALLPALKAPNQNIKRVSAPIFKTYELKVAR